MTFEYNAENVFHFAIIVPEIERGMERSRARADARPAASGKDGSDGCREL
jgi:hypothetical protein